MTRPGPCLQVANYRRERGLDQPVLVQYVRYVGAVARGDFGTSIVTRTPVIDDLAAFVPATVELLGLAMPVFWLGLVLQLVFFRALGWFPAGGRLASAFNPPPSVTGLCTWDALLAGRWDLFLSAAHHLVLPAIALSTLTLGIVARMTRSSLLDVLSSNYVRTARSKGLREGVVIWKHALRNALIPIVTVIGLRLGQMFSGAVLTETVFAWPGVGRYAFTALRQLDFPVVMGFTVWATLIYALVNLIVDLSYSWIDPRVRLS